MTVEKSYERREMSPGVGTFDINNEQQFDPIYDIPKKLGSKPGRKAKTAMPSREKLLKGLDSGHFRVLAEKLTHDGPGLTFDRFYTKEKVHPYDTVEWEKRKAKITNDKGKVIFEQNDIEFPKSWSQLAVNVVVSKYFRGKLGEPTREKSLRHLIDRVVHAMADWGWKQGFFATGTDRDIFSAELTHMLLHQQASFNSPVWFNVGQEEYPQCSACFINSVEDKMGSIMDLAKTEGMLFKYGSGAGSNLSTLRSSKEHLSAGGVASGPVSFMKGYDAFAGVIKSGGKTRRAAKMVILDVEHPDIMDFITCKVNEEKKAWALIDAGYDGSFEGEAYSSVFFQNSNNSVRVSDLFIRKVKEDEGWYTRAVTDGRKMDKFRARELMNKIADAAHICGDPGLQFDDTINNWNPCLDTVRINASNPCSEYMFVDDSACNLASLNLMTFRDETGEFDTEAFKHAVDIFITAQEIIVDNASYPREDITWNSHIYRPLGLGYTNLGSLLMSRGLPYDSDEGRAYAEAVTAVMTGEAYNMSARMAEHFGPFSAYGENRNSFLKVIGMHREEALKINRDLVPEDLYDTAVDVWSNAYENGSEFGFRNAQVTVLAPTGTISFMMDAQTTGVEPDLALVKTKRTVDGGYFTMINNTVPETLERLGYEERQIAKIIDHITKNNTIEDAPYIEEEHLPVFDCALKAPGGNRSISHMGHLRMMGACQKFISGAISKTVNMPEESTVKDIEDVYMTAWELGLKAIAIYRNNSKRIQPMSAGTAGDKKGFRPGKMRRKLPDTRQSITHKFSISGHEGYVTAGMYENGQPGEIFVVMSKEGSSISGLVDGFATMTSIALQYGVPLEDLVLKFSHTRFEPSGFTTNKEIHQAKSIYDYIFRWLASQFMSEDAQELIGNHVEPTITDKEMNKAAGKSKKASASMAGKIARAIQLDAPSCPTCGNIMERHQSCYTCPNCGAQYGCS